MSPDFDDMEAMSRRFEARARERDAARKRLLVDGPDASTTWHEPLRLWMSAGVHCAVLRGPVGGLCGYARTPEGHPWWGLGEDDEVPSPVTPDLEQHPEQFMDDHGTIPAFVAMLSEDGIERYSRTLAAQVQVHGGLTYAGPMAIKHAPWGWWLGFDCGHSGDAIDPAYVDGALARFNDVEIASGAHVWTEDEVALEVARIVTAINLAAPVEAPR